MNKAKSKVMVVDDVPENIDILYNILKDEFEVIAATSGERALSLAFNGQRPSLFLLDVMMPVMDGYQVCRLLKQDVQTRKIPIIFVTAKDDEVDENRGFEYGAVDYITKPIRPSVVKARVRTHLALYDQNNYFEQLVRERTSELEDTRKKIIHRLGKAGEYKDNETGQHIVRVSRYAEVIAKSIGLTPEQIDLLGTIVPMHDIGKIGIPDRILLKSGPLDEEEWRVMKTHTSIGAEILGNDSSELIQEAKSCALCHHEKWDGSGYPEGLSGKKIPLFSRITAIVDVFDALTSSRPYKSAWLVDDACQHLKEQKGIHFDPDLVDCFLENISEILDIRSKLTD